MVHAQQVEESPIRKSYREGRKEKSIESGSSKIQDKTKFKKRFLNHIVSNFYKN